MIRLPIWTVMLGALITSRHKWQSGKLCDTDLIEANLLTLLLHQHRMLIAGKCDVDVTTCVYIASTCQVLLDEHVILPKLQCLDTATTKVFV